MNPLGDPAAIEALAGRFERNAAAIEAVGAQCERRLASSRWACNKADRFRSEMRGVQRTARDRAEALRDIARDLRRHAKWVRDTTSAMFGLERRVRVWIEQHAAEAASWGIRTLPVSGDLGWQTVADRLRKRGAGF